MIRRMADPAKVSLMSNESNQLAAAESGGPGVDGEIRTPLDAAIDWCGKGLAWLVFLAMAISVTEVISRYVFDSPTSWVHETTVFMIAIIFAIGGPVALARDKHIRVRIIYDTVSKATRKKLDLFNSVITFLFAIAMSYAAFVLFWRASHNPTGAWQLERSGTSWNPPFPALTKGIILFALAIMTVQSILHVFKAIQALRTNDTSEES